MTKLTRRTLLGAIGAAAAASALPAVPAFAAGRSIRHYWWGNPERDKRTFAVIDTFQKKNAGIAVSGETIGWGDYWTKMATQTAGRNMADLVQMDYRFLFEYVNRGALKPLDEFAGKSLMIADFDKGPLMAAGSMESFTRSTSARTARSWCTIRAPSRKRASTPT
uniref:extracellular solute-binding protein n=1 Tax=Neorhizobium sp. EC2-8 TaxID=3129230 RepID=UPI0031010407